MQVVSEQFKKAIGEAGRVVTARLSFADGSHVLETDRIQSIDINTNLVSGNDFEIGTAPMTTATITIHRDEFDDFNYETSKARIYLGLKLLKCTAPELPSVDDLPEDTLLASETDVTMSGSHELYFDWDAPLVGEHKVDFNNLRYVDDSGDPVPEAPEFEIDHDGRFAFDIPNKIYGNIPVVVLGMNVNFGDMPSGADGVKADHVKLYEMTAKAGDAYCIDGETWVYDGYDWENKGYPSVTWSSDGDPVYEVEEVAMGLFTIEEMTVRDDFVTLKAVDNMYKAEKPFEGSVSFPATVAQVLQAACTDAGLVWSNVAFPNSTMTIQNDVSFFNVTSRKIIAAVAELAGGYAVIDRNTDELVIRGLGDTSKQTVTNENYFEFDKNESGVSSIDKVVVAVGEVQSSEGFGDNVYSVVNNILVQHPDLPLAALYNVLNGVSFKSGRMRWQGNFALDLADMITVDGLPFYVLNRSISFTGGLRESTSAPAASNVVKDSSVKGSLTLDMKDTKTKISLMDGQIEFAVESIGALSSAQSSLTQTVSSISAEVSMLGSGNIISNAIGDFGTMDWTFDSEPWVAKNVSPVELTNDIERTAFDANGAIMYAVDTDTPSAKGFLVWHAGKSLSKAAPVEGGAEYSLYTRYKGAGDLVFKLREYTVVDPISKDSFSKETTIGISEVKGDWTTITNTLALEETSKSVVLVIESTISVYDGETCTFSDTSLNRGAPKPFAESLANVNTKAEYARTLAETTAEGFSVVTASLTNVSDRLVTAESRLDIQADQISSRVQKNGVISAINQSAEVIQINAGKINLEGVVTTASLAGNGTSTIDGSNIKTGTIDAARLNVSKLSSLSSDLGDITGGSINIGSGKFTVSSSGTVVATSVTITGKVTANNQSSISGSLNSVTGTTGAISGTSFSGWTYGNHSSGYHSGITYAGSGTLGAVNFTSFTGGVRLQGAMQPNTIQTQSPAASNSIAGNLTVYGTFSNPSDRRLKEDIKPINKKDIVDGIYGVDLVTFKFKDREGYRLGVISNDVIDRQPSEFTKYTIYPNDDGYLLADYQTMSVMGLAAIQDLNERVRKLEKKR